jgi:hypothetical protein
MDRSFQFAASFTCSTVTALIFAGTIALVVAWLGHLGGAHADPRAGRSQIAALDGDLVATLSGERYRLDPPRAHAGHSGPEVGDWLTALNDSTVDAVTLVTIDRGCRCQIAIRYLGSR